MKTIRTIGTIAWFEMLILFRSWFFRIFGALILLVLFGFNISIFKDNGGNWAVQGIASNIPYFNILILSLTQAFIAMFLALDFLKRDKKLDTSEVIFTRSMTNWAYVWGKTIGILTVFMVLNLLVLLLALIMNLIMGDLPVNLAAYLYYPLIISLPSLVFILGLSFMVMSVLKNQAIALVILLGYTGMVMFFGKDKFDFIFDFMGFRLPMVHSDMIGFGFEGKLLIQRGIYFILGLSCISGSILLMKRLPQSKLHITASWIMTFAFAVAGVIGIIGYLGSTSNDVRFRTAMTSLDDKYFKTASLNLDACDLAIVHHGQTISVNAKMLLTNRTNESISKTVFSLNPGFILNDLIIDGAKTSFQRDHQLVLVTLPATLDAGRTIRAEFVYKGPVDERVCNLDIKEEQAAEKWGPDFLIAIRKRFAILESRYVLLTPESAWYPRPGVLHGSTISILPALSFTKFTATVETSSGLQPIMQGKAGNSGNTWTFTPENPLPGMTLVIGPYKPQTLTTAGVDFELNVATNHDYFSSVLDSISDTLPKFIGDMKQDLERRLGLKYAYPRLRMIEVPAQFYAYSRLWAKHRDFLQPEMILLPEMGSMLSRSGFGQELRQTIIRSKQNEESLSEKELQLRVLRNFISDNFMPGSSDNRGMFNMNPQSLSIDTDKKFSLFPNFFTFVNHLGSAQYPILNTAIEAYLSNTGDTQMGGFGMQTSGLSAAEQANMELQKKTFKKLLGSEMDNLALRQVIDAKGKYFFTYLEAIAGSVEFMPFIMDEISKSRYHTLDFKQFAEDYKNKFGFDPDSLAGKWYGNDQLPGYLIGHVRVIEVQQDDRTRYQLLFEVSNPSQESGLLQITLRSGSRGGMGGGRGSGGGPGMRGGASFALAGRNAATDKFLVVPAGQAMQVGYILDEQPRAMTVNTMISTNLPNNIGFPFPKLEQIKGFVPIEGQKSIPLILTMSEPGEIVVDNEDVGFTLIGAANVSRMVKWLKINKKNPQVPYESMRSWRPPTFWTPIIQSGFYGDFVRSAVYTKSGEGDLLVEWRTLIQKPGFYDVYTYLNPNIARMGMFRGGGPRPQGGGQGGMPEITDEYHFTVFHSEGKEDITVPLKTAETGWNKLGSFYYAADTAKVTMNNKNTGRTVVADAVKWVKQQ
jgi:ABC-type transport system involved in multi-copper enzyme maturation permease subunit